MEKMVREKLNIRTGKTVRIFLKLKRGKKLARVFIYSQYNGIGDFSPHTRHPEEIPMIDGKPTLQRPAMARLEIGARQSQEFEFVATEDMAFRVMQSLDHGEEISVNARIVTYGKAAQTFRRIFRNTLRKFRGFPASLFRPNV